MISNQVQPRFCHFLYLYIVVVVFGLENALVWVENDCELGVHLCDFGAAITVAGAGSCQRQGSIHFNRWNNLVG